MTVLGAVVFEQVLFETRLAFLPDPRVRGDVQPRGESGLTLESRMPTSSTALVLLSPRSGPFNNRLLGRHSILDLPLINRLSTQKGYYPVWR